MYAHFLGVVLQIASDGLANLPASVTVTCVNLKGRPSAELRAEDVLIKLSDGQWVKLWGLPLAYTDIVTVYSGQVCASKLKKSWIGRDCVACY